jgi:hypothetical protein
MRPAAALLTTLLVPTIVGAASLGVSVQNLVDVAVWPDGHVVVLHDSAGGRTLTKFDSSGGPVWQLAVAGEARSVRIPTSADLDVVLLVGPHGHTLYVDGAVAMSGPTSAGLSPGGTYLLRSEEGAIRIRQIATGSEILSLPVDLSSVDAEGVTLSFGRDNRSVILSGVEPMGVDVEPDPLSSGPHSQWIQTVDLITRERVIRRTRTTPVQVVGLSKDAFAWVDHRGELHFHDALSWSKLRRLQGYSAFEVAECGSRGRILARRPYGYADLFDLEGAPIYTIVLPTLTRTHDIVIDVLEPSRVSPEDRVDFAASLAQDCSTIISSWRHARTFRIESPEEGPSGPSGAADGRVHGHSPDWTYLVVDTAGVLEILTL